MAGDKNFVDLAVSEVGCVQWNPSRRMTVELTLDDGQLLVAIDTLLDAGGPEKRAARIAHLLENEATGAHA